MHQVSSDNPAAFFVTEGPLTADAPCYVERPADTDFYESLRAGRYCYVLSPPQTGKSSLTLRTTARLRADGIAAAILTLSQCQALTAEDWYRGLLEQIGSAFGFAEELQAFWPAHAFLGPLQRWLQALQTVVLARHTGAVVILLDELETISKAFDASELLAGLRECYNRRTSEPALRRLSFGLLGIAVPGDLLREARLTPLNIGRRIELTDFTLPETGTLMSGLAGTAAHAHKLLRRIHYWTHGQPYLTQCLCQALVKSTPLPTVRLTPREVDRLCANIFFRLAAGLPNKHFRAIHVELSREPALQQELLTLYAQVRARQALPKDKTESIAILVQRVGLLRFTNGQPQVRNRIYERVFDCKWIRAQAAPFSNLPQQHVRWTIVLLFSFLLSLLWWIFSQR